MTVFFQIHFHCVIASELFAVMMSNVFGLVFFSGYFFSLVRYSWLVERKYVIWSVHVLILIEVNGECDPVIAQPTSAAGEA